MLKKWCAIHPVHGTPIDLMSGVFTGSLQDLAVFVLISVCTLDEHIFGFVLRRAFGVVEHNLQLLEFRGIPGTVCTDHLLFFQMLFKGCFVSTEVIFPCFCQVFREL